MDLPFLDRHDEVRRLRRALAPGGGSRLVVVYGRRRIGKSRLLGAAIGEPHVFYVGDDREASLQRADLAREMSRLVPGVGDATYPGWMELFDRFFGAAPKDTVLVLDELPSLVRQSPELPSVLQKLIDRGGGVARRLVVCGSSQRMMQGLVLDATAPLYGRAREILRLDPLPAPWIVEAFALDDPADAIERYAVWGGVPRYWELARVFDRHAEAIREIVLDPRGVLHHEPARLLSDELDTTARAASVLALVGAGVRRISEIGARLGVPATTLSRPIARLVELGFLVREVPFGIEERDTKRSFYRIAEPFLAFWFRFVDRHRSLLGSRRIAEVESVVRQELPQHVAEVHEDLARRALPTLVSHEIGVPRRYWAPGQGGKDGTRAVEIDLVAASRGTGPIVLGEVKRTLATRDVARELALLEARADTIPGLSGRTRTYMLFALRGSALEGRSRHRGVRVVGPGELLDALRTAETG